MKPHGIWGVGRDQQAGDRRASPRALSRAEFRRGRTPCPTAAVVELLDSGALAGGKYEVFFQRLEDRAPRSLSSCTSSTAVCRCSAWCCWAYRNTSIAITTEASTIIAKRTGPRQLYELLDHHRRRTRQKPTPGWRVSFACAQTNGFTFREITFARFISSIRRLPGRRAECCHCNPGCSRQGARSSASTPRGRGRKRAARCERAPPWHPGLPSRSSETRCRSSPVTPCRFESADFAINRRLQCRARAIALCVYAIPPVAALPSSM